MKKLFLAAVLACSALATAAPIDGKWLTRDDSDGKAKAIVQISGSTGRIVGVAPGVDNNCTVCKVQGPLIGRTILTGLRPEGNEFEGKITDPKNGRTYSANVTVNGGTLKVCGYVGFKAIGRCQTWTRTR